MICFDDAFSSWARIQEALLTRLQASRPLLVKWCEMAFAPCISTTFDADCFTMFHLLFYPLHRICLISGLGSCRRSSRIRRFRFLQPHGERCKMDSIFSAIFVSNEKMQFTYYERETPWMLLDRPSCILGCLLPRKDHALQQWRSIGRRFTRI